MASQRLYMFTFAILTVLTLFTSVATRAVNISNTWMLPEEDFPVFYRYFRDRISWYEADAVCQFHHANLVTADTSSQYDAIRAYLKELDITDNVWIGLSKKTENSEFVWSDSRILSGEGHWREATPIGGEPLCVTMDPTADFLWKPYSCGGPEAASFICELPVPSWALGQKGCLLTELPSLTVLYIPEHMALELTSDCGLDGTKRITCKGNADREEILKQLTCAISNEDDFDDRASPKQSPSSTTSYVSDASTEESSFDYKTTKSWMWTSNTVDGYEMSTRHRRETEDTLSPSQATIYYRKLDVTEPIPASHVSTSSNYDTEVTSSNFEEELTVPTIKDSSSSGVDSQAEKPSEPTQDVSQTAQNANKHRDDTGIMATTEGKTTDPLGEDMAEYPSAINQGQLFSIIENGTMFDIIELNDTAIDDAKPTKVPSMEITTRLQPKETTTVLPPTSTASIISTTKEQEKKNDFTTVAFYKEPPPSELTQVTNKFPKKFNKQSKTEYYKKSDPKKINYQSEKEQRKVKEEQIDSEKETQTELEKALNKEVEMFPVIDSGGPLVKLNRTHRKELPVMEESEKNIYDNRNVNMPLLADEENVDIVENKLENDGQQKHIEIKLKKNDDSNLTDIFIVTTKFLDEQLGRKNSSHNESTTIFSEKYNETYVERISTAKPTSTSLPSIELKEKSPSTTSREMLIDPRLDELNKNVTQNNESEVLQLTPEEEKAEGNVQVPWEKDEIMSKSLLGEIETITDDVIENNISEMENATSEPLNSEPITAGRPNRRRKLSTAQRRSFYPYFFSRVLG